MDEPVYTINEDNFGKFLVVKIDIGLYPLDSVMKSTYWFTDRYFLYLNWSDQEHKFLEVSFRSKSNADDSNLPAVAGDFLNSVLDQQIRKQIEEESSLIKSIIVKKAFSEGLTEREEKFIKDNK